MTPLDVAIVAAAVLVLGGGLALARAVADALRVRRDGG